MKVLLLVVELWIILEAFEVSIMAVEVVVMNTEKFLLP